MKCKKCGYEMIISEWDGWIWYCPLCEIDGPPATEEELEGLGEADEFFIGVLDIKRGEKK